MNWSQLDNASTCVTFRLSTQPAEELASAIRSAGYSVGVPFDEGYVSTFFVDKGRCRFLVSSSPLVAPGEEVEPYEREFLIMIIPAFCTGRFFSPSTYTSNACELADVIAEFLPEVTERSSIKWYTLPNWSSVEDDLWTSEPVGR